MVQAISAFFHIFTVLFTSAERTIVNTLSATEHLSGALDDCARFAHSESSAFEAEARVQRKARMAALEEALGVSLNDESEKQPPVQVAA